MSSCLRRSISSPPRPTASAASYPVLRSSSNCWDSWLGRRPNCARYLHRFIGSVLPARRSSPPFPMDAQGILAEDENDQFTHERSRYAFKSIPAEGSRTVLDFLRKWPGTHDSAVWKMFFAGGAVASVAPAATAFVHRKALMLTAVDLDWTAEDDEATVARNEAWLGEFHVAMQPF